jgi:hypothetical protein
MDKFVPWSSQSLDEWTKNMLEETLIIPAWSSRVG